MKFSEDDLLLRIFISEKASLNGKPLYEQIVLKAHELKLAGATVVRGIMGFGADSHIHSAKILDLSNDLPIIIEIIDKEEKINLLLPYFDDTITEAFLTLEKVKVIKYRNNIR